MMVRRLQLKNALGSALAPLFLLIYAAGLLFIWYGSRYLSDTFVLVRVGASIVSDLVWLPFGMLVWGAFIWLLIRRLVRPAITVAAVIVVIMAVLAGHHAAFRWMFLPLVFDIVYLLFAAFHHRISIATVLSLLAVTILVAGYYRGQLTPSPTPGNGGGMTLKVMSYNIYSYAGNDNRVMQIDTIIRENPDIVCIMEFNPRADYRLFHDRLDDRYPYMVSNRGTRSWNSGELIMSRYPITSKRVVAIPGSSSNMDFIFAEIEVGGRIINVANFHLITVGHEIIDQVFSSRSIAERIDNAVRPERERDHIKYEQAKELVDFAGKLEDPIILCGDMNDTPNSRTYGLFAARYTNAFKAAGWGLGDTFGELSLARKLSSFVARDVIRIDQIFVGRDIRVLSARVIDDAQGSDHKPIVATVGISGALRPE